jgi:general secretion pathway protein E
MPDPHLDIQGPDGHRQLPLTDQPVTVGRHKANTIVLGDDRASRYHCVFEKIPEGWRVRDLDSSNGTKVNGQSAKNALLGDGDTVTVGRTSMRLVSPDARSIASAPSATAGEEAFVEVEVDMDELEEVHEDPADFEGNLRRMAESLPEKKFSEGDIVLTNARGVVAHPRVEPPRKKPRQPEPLDAVDILRLVLVICFRTRASDIHVEPKQDMFQVRIRVDGTMVDIVRLPKEMGIRVMSLVKVLSDIDIAQRNIVQEGHFSSPIPGRRVDYRVSFAPSMYGQKLVVRILDAANAPYHVWDLHLPQPMYDTIMAAMRQDSGMFLACGPTGSGKTSTLYAVIRDIDVGERNVVTIEDPVEIELEGVTQIPVNEAQGNTFSALLRSVLRQDPDAILVGEVRDPETARIALQAAITGHLVFSTVHARDTLGSIFRLLDLGVEPYLVATGLQLVLAQRLVRQLCPACRLPRKPTPEQLAKMGPYGAGVEQLFGPQGCPRCVGTGYFGRRGIFELLKTTDELRDLILRSPNMTEMQKALSNQQFVKLHESGFQLVAEGVTSYEEVERSL